MDGALRDPVKRTRKSIEHNVDRLVERYRRVQLERDHVTTERVDRLQGFLCPEGVPQERFYSLPYFACKYGAEAFKQKILGHLTSFDLFGACNLGVRDIDL
jgi:hypothetical protein